MQFLDITSYMADMIYQLVPGVRRQGNNQLNFRCPICGDGKKKTSRRGHFYLKDGTYYCWNAGCPAHEHGMTGLQFLSALTKKPQYQIKAELIKLAGDFHNALNTNSQTQSISNNSINDLFNDLKSKSKKDIQQNIKLDENWIELPHWVQELVDQRKIYKSQFITDNWKLYFDKKTNRLVIPWTNDYYQLRALTKKQEQESGKYLFPPEIEKPIFGLNMIDTSFKYLFLLEGVFDAIFVKNGLAVGSLNLSNHQQNILDDYKEYTIVYFMDNQYKDKSSYDQTLKLCKEKPWINLFIWPEQLKQFKDVNDTIIYNDDFLRLWSNEQFLKSRIFNRNKSQITIN